MNLPNVIFQLGLLLLAFACGFVALAGFAAIGADPGFHATRAFLLSAAITTALAGGMMYATRKRDKYIGRREALLLVALSWMLGAAIAALPYYFWAHFDPAQTDAPFRSFVDCYFESMSGLSTTGATILSDIRQLPDALLLWRSMTHWFGGLGIVVLFVAVLPSLGVGGKKLFRVESTGVAREGLQPTIRDMARVLWYIYSAMSLVCVLALWIAGMSLFDAICHTMSMISTGGLSTRDASIGYYNSAAIDIVCIFTMLLAGANFGLFFAITRKRWGVVWKDAELRFYIALKVAVTVLVAWNIWGMPLMLTTSEVIMEPTVGDTIRASTFTTVSLHTGTGFCTTDYALWPYLSQSLLIGLMFIGGCAGSTAGGVKVIRIWIALKVMVAEIEKAFRPNVVRPLRINNQTIDDPVAISAIAYVFGFFLIGGAGALLIRMFEHGQDVDLLTTITASLSTLGNIGPGLGLVGARENYAWFSDPSKLLMSVLMALGRLEMFAFVVLLAPRFWRGN